jgi:hypothetical protein
MGSWNLQKRGDISIRTFLPFVAIGVDSLLTSGLACGQLMYEVGKGDGRASYTQCEFETFNRPNEAYMTQYITDPFTVRRVQGCLTSQGGPWPEGVQVVFEIRAKGGDPRIYHAEADEKGDYRLPKLPEGEYCFRAMAVGWQTVCGVVIVSRKAPRKAQVSFEMPLDK